MTTNTKDPTAFLHAQHEEVKQLFEQLAAPGAASKSEAFQCLVRLLAVHETAEEEIVYPAVRAKADNTATVVDARLKEEAEAKQKLSELEKLGVDAPGFDQKLAIFRDAVLRHAEAEESTIFPTVRAGMSPEQSTMMVRALEVAEKLAPTHPHPHGPESATGNLLVGPFVAIADRVRDTLKKRAS